MHSISRRELVRGACRSLAILIFADAALSSVPTTAAPLKVAELDLRTKTAVDKYFVVFSARSPSLLPEALSRQNFSLGGHLYVAWGREDSSHAMSYAQSYGAHPVEDDAGKWSLFNGPIPGEIRGELEKDIEYRLICKVDKDAYDDADVVRQAWLKKASYQLVFEDCTTFANEVAAKIGLRVPERGPTTPSVWFPAGYTSALIDANPQAQHLDGTWVSADNRWRLEIRRDTCVWIEHNASGSDFRYVAKLEQPAPGKAMFRISRPNDASYLAFAGARPDVIPAILARGPEPSFMELMRSSVGQLNASWNGLRWTLDAQNRLTGIQQPGAAPKSYVMTPA